MSDFPGLLRAYVAEQSDRAEARATVDPGVQVRLVAGRARRRRAARAGAIAGAAAVVVLAAAAGVVAVTRPDPLPPVESPTPVVSPRPTPSPAPTPSPTETAEADAVEGSVTVHPYLPPVEALPAGLLAQTTPDWLLLQYRAWGPDGEDASPTVLYLRDPGGRLYEVPVPAEVLALDYWWPADWTPGTSRLLVAAYVDADDTVGTFEVDLAGGAVTPAPTSTNARVLLAGDGYLEVVEDGGRTTVRALDASGAVQGSVGPFAPVELRATDLTSLGWAVNPSHTRLLVDAADGLRLYDVTAGLRELPTTAVHRPGPPDGWCSAEAWLDDDRFTLACNQWFALEGGGEGLADEIHVVDLAAGSSTLVAGGAAKVGGALTLDDVSGTWNIGGSVALLRDGTRGQTCPGRLVRPDGATTTDLPAPAGLATIYGVVGDLVVGATSEACDTYVDEIGFDAVTGAQVSLVPRVAGAEGDQVELVLRDATRARILW